MYSSRATLYFIERAGEGGCGEGGQDINDDQVDLIE